MNKCILCGRCEKVCGDIQTVNALTKIGRGFSTKLGCPFDQDMKKVRALAVVNARLCAQLEHLLKKTTRKNFWRCLLTKIFLSLVKLRLLFALVLPKRLECQLGRSKKANGDRSKDVGLQKSV